MQPEKQLPPRTINSTVLSFCEELSTGNKPEWVPVSPWRESKMQDCHPNVSKRIARDGGSQIYGWQISEVEGLFLEAEFHSVWCQPSGLVLDISPEAFGQKRILFVKDDHLKYVGIEVPHRRYPLIDSPLIQDLWFHADIMARKFMSLIHQGYPTGHPAYREQVEPHRQKYNELKRSLTRRYSE
jgi:hypothetical protein